MRSRHLPSDGPEMAQPWKFHSLAVVVSSRIQGLGVAGAAGLVAGEASGFDSAGAVAAGAAFVSAGASDFAAAGASGFVCPTG